MSPPGRIASAVQHLSVPQQVHFLAKEMDDYEAWLTRTGPLVGLPPEWSPIYERRQRSGVSAPTSWGQKAGAINGAGDLHTYIGEQAVGMDVLFAKKADIEERLPAPAEAAADPFKRATKGKR